MSTLPIGKDGSVYHNILPGDRGRLFSLVCYLVVEVIVEAAVNPIVVDNHHDDW